MFICHRVKSSRLHFRLRHGVSIHLKICPKRPAMSAKHSADSGQVSPFRKSKIMMRMGLIVVGLSTLTIMELGTPCRTKTSAPDPFDQLMTDASVSPDTLETLIGSRRTICRTKHSGRLQLFQQCHRTWTPWCPESRAPSASVQTTKRTWSESKNLSQSTQQILTNLCLSEQAPTKLQ